MCPIVYPQLTREFHGQALVILYCANEKAVSEFSCIFTCTVMFTVALKILI